jgi:preprotein translocase subunit SecF
MKNKKYVLSLVAIIALIAVAGVGYLVYNKYKVSTDTTKQESATVSQEDQDKAKAETTVNKLKEVLFIEETDQKPAVATIVDPAKVKESNPDFYKNAQKDDVLVVYPERAIIFRQSDNKIINIAPIVKNSDPAKTTTETKTTTPEIKTPEVKK